MLSINTTCNSTLDDLRSASEIPIAGKLTFHNLALIISAACSLVAIVLSLFLIWMHATHYTKPCEQRHIIRILFMIPVYATASFLSLKFYWHAIYFQVISDCYEAFAIASFFALLCHYIAPNLHDQKDYFRGIAPKPWILPVSLFKKCCGGERGPWKTPRSGLTWFNIIWSGVYQYCFIRVAMTITAVLTQYFGRYCESSNSPVFAHIWILVIEGVAVSIAMFCLFQFYFQLRIKLAPHNAFLKVVAIKLVIFLSFWQTFLISILTSSKFKVISETSTVQYPDIKVGVPSLLLCIEMSIFAILHLFAFPYKPYATGAQASKYPLSPSDPTNPNNEVGSKQGGPLGIKAIGDAMNPWDLVKGFARSMRWLFVGRKHRENDLSYKSSNFSSNVTGNENDLTLEPTRLRDEGYKGPDGLPIANQFSKSNFGLPGKGGAAGPGRGQGGEEGAGLIAHAQPNPLNSGSAGYTPARQRYDSDGKDISHGGTRYDGPNDSSPEGSPDRIIGINPGPGTVRRQEHALGGEIGMAVSGEPEPYTSHVPQPIYSSEPQSYLEQKRAERRQKPSEQWAQSSSKTQKPDDAPPEVHNALWGNPGLGNDGKF